MKFQLMHVSYDISTFTVGFTMKCVEYKFKLIRWKYSIEHNRIF